MVQFFCNTFTLDREAIYFIFNNILALTMNILLTIYLEITKYFKIILAGSVDLLLYLLSNITDLPVTKDMVTSSKLGRAVAGVEKHRICVGGLNETAIKERVSRVKEQWSASVRRMKQIVSFIFRRLFVYSSSRLLKKYFVYIRLNLFIIWKATSG